MNINFTTNGRDWVAVKVPSDATNFDVNNLLNFIGYDNPETGSFDGLVEIPKGNWQIVGLLSEIEKDEERAKELVKYSLKAEY